MKIRKAILNDAAQIAKVHVDSWRTTYKDILPDEFLTSLSYEQRTTLWQKNVKEQQVYVVEKSNGKIIGFSVGGKERTGNYDGYDGEIYAIYIFKEYQGKGIGKMLMQPVVENLELEGINSMIVLVLEDNPAKYFYESLGAKKIDTLKIKIADAELNELVYGWDDMSKLLIREVKM
ncbi:GNAT family N-acetyltransferase [Virgibacillus sp. C22-A2]|uniref:GNAT family N-acetyltransferase n=1 Tax=Virgibacillus tibetensis TaxID=3042313 RepID=A0ABU6KKJ6_9BACI|nr:GNAT family N-acetyltransferase [Virgibacillus sp. C22-A2]